MKKKLLIIDDDKSFNQKLQIGMKEYIFVEALDIESANSLFKLNQYDLILLDLNLNPNTERLDGLDLISPIKTANPKTPLIVVTADQKTETVVTAMKLGADDFLRKGSFDLLSWKKKFELLIENQHLKDKYNKIEKAKGQFIGNSDIVVDIKNTLQFLAGNPEISVLITGETGVGKEVAARFIHQQSKRSINPFIAVNLSALSPTLIESALFGHKKGSFTGAENSREGYLIKADGGILFIDEIGDLSLDIQVKLLRFLEDKKISRVGEEKEIQLDLQIITATNKNLKMEIKNGRFRADLYFRLKNFIVEIPPLRDRKEDIPVLLSHFFKRYGFPNTGDIFTDRMLELFAQFKWPGNVRELKHTVDYIYMKSQGRKITLEHLPKEMLNGNHSTANEKSVEFPIDFEMEVSLYQLKLIDAALGKTFGNKSVTAEMLNLNLDKLRYKILSNRKLLSEGEFTNIDKYYNHSLSN